MKKPFLISLISIFFIGPMAARVSAIIPSDDEFTLDKVYPLADKGTIYLNSSDAEVEIKGGKRNDVRVKIYYKLETKGITFGSKDAFSMEVDERNGDLYIQEKKRESGGAVIGYQEETYEITIEAPEGANLNIQGDDDDYHIFGINGSIWLKADDGDVKLESCKGDRFEIEIEDGEIEMNEGKGYLSLNLEDGKVLISNGKFEEVLVSIDDGDILIATDLINNANYSINSQDGRVDLNILKGGGDFQINRDDGRVTVSSEFKLMEKHHHQSKYNLSGGNAQVKITVEDGRVRLRKL